MRATLSSDPKVLSRDRENVERRELRPPGDQLLVELRATRPVNLAARLPWGAFR